jgi:uncharacterized membrane protein
MKTARIKLLLKPLGKIPPEVWALILMSLAFGLLFSHLNTLKLLSFFSFEPEDAAVENQLLYNLVTAGRFTQTLFFGGSHDHFWPIAFVLAPFYALRPSITTWYALMSFSYGLCSIIFYLIARDLLASMRLAFLIALIYLFYAPLHYLALGAIDGGRNFALPLLALTLFFMHKKRFGAYCASALLVCMCKEDMPLIILALGLYQSHKGFPSRWWQTTVALSLVYLCVALVFLATIFKPWPRQPRALEGFYYLDLRNAGLFVGLIRHHLLDALSYALHPSKLRALFLLGWPLLFLPMFALELYIPAAMFAIFFLARPRFFNQNSDYLAPIIPFIFLALCYVFVKLKKRYGERRSLQAAGLILALCLAQQFTRTILGCTAKESGRFNDPDADLYDRRFRSVTCIFDRRLYTIDDEDRRAMELVRRIPPDVSVTASGSFLPLLAARRVLYEFGTFRTAFSRRDRRREEAQLYAADVVLLDRKCRNNGLGGTYFCPDADTFRQELDKIVNAYRYKLQYDDGDFVLLSSPLGLRSPRPDRP